MTILEGGSCRLAQQAVTAITIECRHEAADLSRRFDSDPHGYLEQYCTQRFRRELSYNGTGVRVIRCGRLAPGEGQR